MQNDFCQILRSQCHLAPRGRVLVAVSGGLDSVVLLHLFVSCAARYPLTVTAAHLDHGMRPESAEEADFVRKLCARLGVPLTLERIEISRRMRAGEGVEAAARAVRREFLRRTAASLGCSAIALGHHRDDQAETVLLRLLRGSGPTGLAAMRMRSGPFIRPLLAWPRSRLRAYLEERALANVEDSSNADPAFTRNRVRHEVLPLLRSFNPSLDAQLAELAAQFAAEESFWDSEIKSLSARLCHVASDGLALSRSELLALHPAVRARLLRAVVARARGDLRGIGRGHLQSIESLLAEGRPQREAYLPGAWVARRYDRLLFAAESPALPAQGEIVVAEPGRYPLPGGGVLTVTFAEGPRGENENAVEFSGIYLPLTVRPACPGDRFRPSGMVGHKKLKDFFIDGKIERERRRRVSLVVADEILWVVGLRRCAGHRPSEGEEAVLRLIFDPPPSTDNPLVKTEGLW